MAVGADDVHLHFARGVAAQPRAILKQDHSGAVPRRGDRGADAREAAAGDKNIRVEIDLRHMRLSAGAGLSGAIWWNSASILRLISSVISIFRSVWAEAAPGKMARE